MIGEVKNESNRFVFYYTIILSLSCVFFVHVAPIVSHCLIFLLMILTIIHKYNTIFRRMPVNGFFVSRILFIMWAMLSYTWATSFDEFSNRILTYIYSYMLIYLTYILYDDEKKIFLFFKVCTLSGFLLSLYIIYNSGYHILALERLDNDVMSINTAATKFAYITIMQMIMYNETANKLYALPIVFFISMVIITGSKTAFFMVLLSGIVLFCFKRYRTDIEVSKKHIIIILFSLVLIYSTVIYIPALYQIIGRRLDSFVAIIIGEGDLNSSYSTYTRFMLVMEAWNGFTEKPLTGWGENNMIYFSAYNLHAHSSMMEILFDLGAVGFCLYFYQYVCLYKILKSIRKRNYFSYIVISIMIASLVEIITSISHNDLLNWLMLLFSYIFLKINKRSCNKMHLI